MKVGKGPAINFTPRDVSRLLGGTEIWSSFLKCILLSWKCQTSFRLNLDTLLLIYFTANWNVPPCRLNALWRNILAIHFRNLKNVIGHSQGGTISQKNSRQVGCVPQPQWPRLALSDVDDTPWCKLLLTHHVRQGESESASFCQTVSHVQPS